MPYKLVFTRLIPDLTPSTLRLDEVLTFTSDGQLALNIASAPEPLAIPIKSPTLSTLVMASATPQVEAVTPDGRYHVEISSFVHLDVTEFWLIHTDRANGKFKRAKLSTEWQTTWRSQPQVSISPKGSFFIADDSGIIRLYSAAHLVEIGTFQVAHPHTENEVVALAVSQNERLVAGLSSWKDVVLYNIPDRKVDFVRQIRDGVGWYEPTPATIMIAGSADAIFTAGVGLTPDQQTSLSLNAFQYVSLNLP